MFAPAAVVPVDVATAVVETIVVVGVLAYVPICVSMLGKILPHSSVRLSAGRYIVTVPVREGGVNMYVYVPVEVCFSAAVTGTQLAEQTVSVTWFVDRTAGEPSP